MRASVTELTGRAGGPPLALGVDLLDNIAWLGDELNAAARAAGRAASLDPFEVVTRRAALSGLRRNGSTTAGGAGRLLRAADDWIALSLPRPDDVGTLSAWLGEGISATDPWVGVEGAVARRPAAELVELGGLLGLPVGRVGEVTCAGGRVVPVARAPGEAAALGDLRGLHVVDCSSLWAGPLCARILQSMGATVTKLESVHRPDGARSGSKEFYRSLHAGQPERRVEFRTRAGRAELRSLLAAADVVIEGSRPRAFEQLGIEAAELLAGGRTRLWISVTAYGRTGRSRDRVGFGDDAAAAGGLVAWDDAGPCFVGDAIADPLTGMAAAVAALEVLAAGGRWLLDASLARTAAFSARVRGS